MATWEIPVRSTRTDRSEETRMTMPIRASAGARDSADMGGSMKEQGENGHAKRPLRQSDGALDQCDSASLWCVGHHLPRSRVVLLVSGNHEESAACRGAGRRITGRRQRSLGSPGVVGRIIESQLRHGMIPAVVGEEPSREIEPSTQDRTRHEAYDIQLPSPG